MSDWLPYPENKPDDDLWCLVTCWKDNGFLMHYRLATYRKKDDVFVAFPTVEHEQICLCATHYLPIDLPKETK